jgi:hypothetical protein
MKIKSVRVKFTDNVYSRLYDFMYDSTFLTIKRGDTVVVDTVNGLQLAKVEAVAVNCSSQATKWVVDKVDTTSYLERAEVGRKAGLLKKKMEERRKKIQDAVLFKQLAETDSEMALLLAEYEALNIAFEVNT